MKPRKKSPFKSRFQFKKISFPKWPGSGNNRQRKDDESQKSSEQEEKDKDQVLQYLDSIIDSEDRKDEKHDETAEKKTQIGDFNFNIMEIQQEPQKDQHNDSAFIYGTIKGFDSFMLY